MALGTNGTSIYRPYNTPPGTVCTGDGIGIQIRNADGDVVFVLGLYDGKIYFGDAWADPSNPVVRQVPMSATVPAPPGPQVVEIEGALYVTLGYINVDGRVEQINFLKSLYDDLGDTGTNGMIARGLFLAALGDLAPSLVSTVRDWDGDGDRDLTDVQYAFDDMFTRASNSAYESNDNVTGLGLTILRDELPDIIGRVGEQADQVTGDDNLPPPPPSTDDGGGPSGDWFF